MKSAMLVGPILNDIEGAGMSGDHSILATAYYTAGPLGQLRISAKKVTLAVRLNFADLTDWISGGIDPPALLQAASCWSEAGSEVKIYIGKNAHAKFYMGEHSILIGSANLTTRGLSGLGDEVMWCVPMCGEDRKSFESGVRRYLGGMELIRLTDLERFVDKNASLVEKKKKNKLQSEENRPRRILEAQRPLRLGSYSNFLDWLTKQQTAAAREILARANGKNNLSGHIYRNYYGIRQYLIYSPQRLDRFRSASEDNYKLSLDATTEGDIARFVKKYATDEADFSLETWKTYLPAECGGRAGKHGGTIGNLNKMLPLVAKYLTGRLKRS